VQLSDSRVSIVAKTWGDTKAGECAARQMQSNGNARYSDNTAQDAAKERKGSDPP